MNASCRLGLALLSLLAGGRAAAVTTGAELADTCARALATDYRGLYAGMCDWYVAPCEICGTQPPPRTWCPPAGTATRTLAAAVVAGLEAHPEMATRDARGLVAEILTAAYPCAGDAP